MEKKIVPANNPAALAQQCAEDMVMRGELDTFELSEHERERIAELDRIAEQSGWLDQSYVVDSHRSILLPAHIEEGSNITTQHFNRLMFSGELRAHAVVRLENKLGNNAIRAVCMMFDNVTLLPYFDKVPEDRLLYTPAHAIASMQ